ncbi:Coiled-coil domain-containing protein 142 [Labeo rohita]|uniref:Coiled-coil domain-containing protein 142 n=1 Tax=Labeo rohita TaxID=84645 RepID=A0ABQ8L0R1_LABRO|nr:Coiled-coil domain-containing protein 142 [Labeo rohita]
MAYSSGGSQEGQTDIKTKTHTQAVLKISILIMDRGSQVTVQRYFPRNIFQITNMMCPFTKSLQRAEALFRNRFNPSLKWLMGQKDKDGSWDSESESIMSCSSRNIQCLGQTLQSLSSQCHMLHDPASGGKLFGTVTSLYSSEQDDFYHHPQAATFAQHYCQLQRLMDNRAQLLFLHEYSHRTHVATCFVVQLRLVLEKTHLLLADRGQVDEQPNSTWNLSLRALCQEMQVHINHWALLWAKARSDFHLRCVLFSRVKTLASMRQTLHLLGFQALWLMEHCIHTALSALAAAQLDRVPRDALVDLLCAIELYNQIIEDKWNQGKTSAWCSQFMFSSCWPRLGSILLQNRTGPKTFPVEQLMMILAQSQAQKAAEQLYTWSSQQSNLLHMAKNPNKLKCHFAHPNPNSDLSSSPTINIHAVQLEPQAAYDALKMPQKPTHSLWSSNVLFSSFITRDRECLDALFQVLVTSTNLLAPLIPKKPLLNRTADLKDTVVISRGASEGEERLLNRPRMTSKTYNVAAVDFRKSDAYMKLFSHYKKLLWGEFAKAVVRQFHYQPYNSTLGSINQWNDEMVLHLATWLKHSYIEDLIPQECKGNLRSFCFYILSTAAFTQWDEMMCLSLGSGLKEKCVPGFKQERCAVRTTTMDLILQLFPPLHIVLQLLQSPDVDSVDSGSKSLKKNHLGLLCRSVATVQSSTVWVMSKAYQFLASWSLTKFLLVTQGDLKDLKDSVDGLVHLTQAAGRDSKMSVEIFEQTMPPAKHWRIKHKTELPSSPSDYAASAAQSVIGQVLEGVQPLPDDARIPALTEAMTAFMEAWMEHILKQKIKFSIQGALQLKQDFDLIRNFIRSEEYSLSEELHQKLLSLRVFHQVDNAIVCLLQQPMAKPYLPSRSWEPFRHCCPSSGQVMDQTAGSLNNLESMDIQVACQQALTQAESSVTPELLSSTPPESYLAVAQQEWLDLRIHSSSRWKLPVLHCFTKSEP